jgi:hypothetical protein
MQPGKTLRARAGRLSIAAALGACALMPASASAATGRPSDGTLSPRLAELAKPSVRSLPPTRQARLLGLPRSGPGSLLRRGTRVFADVRFDHGAAAGVDALRAAGAEIANVSRRYQTATVAVGPGNLRAVARVPHVAGVTEALRPLVYAAESTCPQGVAISEGDEQLRAAEAREAFGVDGSGVTVGILSDSFDKATKAVSGGPIETHAKEDVENGDLPGEKNTCPGQETPVDVLEDFSPIEPGEEAADEGRAMAQIVHDVAPGASLAFATAFFEDQIPFAENIETLAEPTPSGAEANVIVDDVAYFDEPFFQEGPVGIAVSKVTAKGVAYFSAAGNDNLIDASGRDMASWETPRFRDSGGCPAPLVTLSGEIEEVEGPGTGLNPDHCVDFNPGTGVDTTFGITVSPGAVLLADLQWAEPWEGVNDDIDAFLLNSEGEVVSDSIGDNSKSQKPFELLGWENTSGSSKTVRLAINRYSGPSLPRLKFALLENGGGVTATEYPESTGGDIVGPTIFGHSGARDAMSIGAIRYNSSSAPERYSSRGPVSRYFGPADGAGPAEPLASPEVLSKPDVVATDCGATTFFAFEEAGVWRFCGTSAAAPHAAAVAALMLEGHPTATPERIGSLLRASAVPVGSFGPCAIGGGLVDAMAAIEEFKSPVVIGPAACTPPVSPPLAESLGNISPPTIAITERPAPLSRNRTPRIGFSANRPVSFACSLDGGALEPCSSPFTPALPLADGNHGFVVTGVDVAGLTGTSETVAFKVDTKRPRTFFRRRPRKLVRTRHRKARAAFRFGSNEEGVTFTCRVDGGLPRFCGERLTRRFRIGLHSVRVAATDAAGNTDRTPAVYRFKVKHVG